MRSENRELNTEILVEQFDADKEYEELTAVELQQMRENNKLDLVLYERVLDDMNAQLAQQEPSFWKELALFKKMQQGTLLLLLLSYSSLTIS